MVIEENPPEQQKLWTKTIWSLDAIFFPQLSLGIDMYVYVLGHTHTHPPLFEKSGTQRK